LSEVEAALIILSKDEDQVFRIISKLITDKGYNYKKNGIQIIHDTYFDTKNDLLKQNGIALRIRNINEHIFKITLKILQNSTEHYAKRVEIEDNYSNEMLRQIIMKLNSYLNLNLLNFSFEHVDNNPILNLTGLGLKIIQNKKTERKIVNAINKSSHKVDFEFCFDTTTYILNNNYISIQELEIESKHLETDLVLSQFVKELSFKKDQFRYWPFNKLLTGKVLEALFYNNELKENKDYDDKKILTLSGIEKIELFIKNKEINVNKTF
jgi:uncharacterized protein YjbK